LPGHEGAYQAELSGSPLHATAWIEKTPHNVSIALTDDAIQPVTGCSIVRRFFE